jgi:hypothetical protein
MAHQLHTTSFLADVIKQRNVTALSLAVYHEGGKAPLTRLNTTQQSHGLTFPTSTSKKLFFQRQLSLFKSCSRVYL